MTAPTDRLVDSKGRAWWFCGTATATRHRVFSVRAGDQTISADESMIESPQVAKIIAEAEHR